MNPGDPIIYRIIRESADAVRGTPATYTYIKGVFLREITEKSARVLLFKDGDKQRQAEVTVQVNKLTKAE